MFESKWVYLAGSTTVNSNGCLGGGDYSNGIGNVGTPSSRWMGCSFTDPLSKDVFIFGGTNDDNHNDVWRFDFESKTFTWVKGSSSCDVQCYLEDDNDFHDDNVIGARHGIACGASRVSRSMYVFGGRGISFAPETSILILNDLWEFSIANSQWRYVTGTKTTEDGVGNRVDQGSYSSSSYPSGRDMYTMVSDDITNEMYLFGGRSIGAWNLADSLNDLWKFNQVDNEWMWIKGDGVKLSGSYGSYGDFSTSYLPRSRYGHTAWVLKSNFFIFAGLYQYQTTLCLNSMWVYNSTLEQWGLLAGDDDTFAQSSDFRNQGSYTSLGHPGEMYGLSGFTFEGNDDEIFFFGGVDPGNGYFQALWSFKVSTFEYRWMSGSDDASISSQNPSYSEPYEIGGRYNFPITVSRNMAYIFSGQAIDENQAVSYINDLWIFIPDHTCDSVSMVTDYESVCGNLHGTCHPDGTCNCDAGFLGLYCSGWLCNGVVNDDPWVCSGHGTCQTDGTCHCPGYTDNTCSLNLNELLLWVGIPVGVVVVIIIGLCALLLCAGILYLVIKFFVGYAKMVKKTNLIKDVNNDELKTMMAEKKAEDQYSVSFKIKKELFIIDYDTIQLLKERGRGGSNSTIYEAEWDGKKVAIKVYSGNAFSQSTDFTEFEREVSIMSSISHPNICTFYGATLKEPRIGIVMEYCEKGDLRAYIGRISLEKESALEFNEKLRILGEIANAMNYLHDRNILHRDLKCSNVLLANNLNAKLIDFGLSKIVENMSEEKTSRVGTSYYIAPEVLLGRKYSEKCDVYSFSYVLFELITENINPYGKVSSVSRVELKISNDPDYRPQFSNEAEYPEWIVSLIRKCWIHKSEDRPSFKDIKESLKEQK